MPTTTPESAVEKVPAAQRVQTVTPGVAPEYVPAAQAVQVAEEKAAWATAKVPTGQAVQAEALVGTP
jgi:hypothetical protein